jgi:hypothetical protein
MNSLFVLVTLAVSALGAPTSAVSQSQQGGAAAGGLAGAVANVAANAAAKVVDADVLYNNIGNGNANNLNANVLSARTDAAAQGLQGADAAGLLAGVGANGLVNAAAKVADVDAECNDILNDNLNDANISILRARDAVAQAAQGGNAVAGLVAAVANVFANADIKGIIADIKNNNILNDNLNNLNLKLLSGRSDGVVAAAQGLQKGNAVAGLAAAVVNALANIGLTGVDADVLYNNILNDNLNNLNANILSARTDAAAQALQGGAAAGAIAAVVNAFINGAVKGVDLDVIQNNILNGNLNNALVKVLSA